MRPTLTQYFMGMLELVASRATCPRRKVGCIITDDPGHIISTGYNGVPSGFNHCIDQPCAGAGDRSGNNENCIAIHAEQNALLQAGDRLKQATTMYCSTLPCFHCAKLICNTPIKRIFVAQWYNDQRGLDLFIQAQVQVSLYQ